MAKMDISQKRTLIAGVLVVLTIVTIMFVFVYPISSYYEQSGTEKEELRKLEKLKEANKKILQERRNLSTDEEVERIAREQYQLIRPGEQAYIVNGQSQ